MNTVYLHENPREESLALNVYVASHDKNHFRIHYFRNEGVFHSADAGGRQFFHRLQFLGGKFCRPVL